MRHLRRIFSKFYLLFANSKVEADLAREIGAHLGLLEEEYRRQGMTPEDARRAARLAYGGVEQATQLHRDARAFQGLGQIVQDTRHTFRQLGKSPGFTAMAILILALGIGATTAIFSIVEGVLLRPLPFPDPDRLVVGRCAGRLALCVLRSFQRNRSRHPKLHARHAELQPPGRLSRKTV